MESIISNMFDGDDLRLGRVRLSEEQEINRIFKPCFRRDVNNQVWFNKSNVRSLEPSCKGWEQNVRKLASGTFALYNTCKRSFHLKRKRWRILNWTEKRRIRSWPHLLPLWTLTAVYCQCNVCLDVCGGAESKGKKASSCKNNGCAQQSLPPQLCTGPCGRRILNSWWMKQSESSLLKQSLARTAH